MNEFFTLQNMSKVVAKTMGGEVTRDGLMRLCEVRVVREITKIEKYVKN